MIVGIDLGTTNSLIAVWEDGAPKLIPNALGEVLTPSCVSLDEDGTLLVGRPARERLQSHPQLSASVFKRYMGSDRQMRIGSHTFRAEDLSAMVLKSLKEDAEAYLKTSVTEAIITVPAYFSDAQRKATRAAARIAGLKADRLLNEPSAAALAYGIHKRDQESKFLVFDLGGGTFDVSVLDLFEGVMEVRASAGDNFLGGEDFVQIIADHCFQEAGFPVRLRKDAAFMQRLMAAAESLKRGLSERPEASLRFPVDGGDFILRIDEATLETLSAGLLQRLRDPVERALRDARIPIEELDAILLAGGASRMPMVRRLVEGMFGRPPACEINPDEVVALGSAVQAGLLMKDVALIEVVMTDVSPYSLGIDVSKEFNGKRMEGHFDPIIERNSAVPMSRVKRYIPAREGQSSLVMNIFQGEARLVQDNICLGRLEIVLPKGSREECGVDVRFTYDVDGLLEVEATVVKTGLMRRLVIKGNAGMLSDEEIEARFKKLAALKIHPREKMENRTTIARGDRLYQMLNGVERERFGAAMTAFDQAMDTQDDRIIGIARKQLEEIIESVENMLILGSGTIQ